MNRLHPATMIVAFLPKLYDAFRQVLPFLALSFFTGKGDRTELFIAAIGVLGGFPRLPLGIRQMAAHDRLRAHDAEREHERAFIFVETVWGYPR